MSIRSFAIRSVRKLLNHLENEPRLLVIEADNCDCPMHAINELLKKKYTYGYTALIYRGCNIEAATTVSPEEIASAVRSWIGCCYDVAVVNENIKLTHKKNDK